MAVVLPALLLMTAVPAAPAAAAAARPSPTASADPAEPPDQNGGQQPPGDPGADPSAPPADPSADPSAPPADPSADPSAPPGEGEGGDGGGGNESPIAEGPNADDFANIRQAPRVRQVRNMRGASRGTFSSRCGTNQEEHHNPDNFIVAPGVQNGAHHIHDYVGNESADAFSTDESLAASGTTCTNGDLSTYYWPVMRDRNGQDDSDAAQQSAADGNVGSIVLPSRANIQFRGNPRSKVTAMPRFMRVIMGDAKAGTNGLANARAFWTCSGFTDRGFTDKYPLCPRNSQVMRVLDFPSCWDGQNTDSANHRDHIRFPQQNGACPQGTQAVPQLRLTLSYNLPNRAQAFAVDSFPEQGHDPVTDHADFVNVMPDRLMQRAVRCINGGRRC
ncbi:DUF1996 domain-containing protein [Spirillospora sp. NPDC029432]|uniref:DUF1996 domain-containing protein n=1 Tax=Spirillospora sp. NPDC029432 TaxID=3154599 RepID=UPI0034523A01